MPPAKRRPYPNASNLAPEIAERGRAFDDAPEPGPRTRRQVIADAKAYLRAASTVKNRTPEQILDIKRARQRQMRNRRWHPRWRLKNLLKHDAELRKAYHRLGPATHDSPKRILGRALAVAEAAEIARGGTGRTAVRRVLAKLRAHWPPYVTVAAMAELNRADPTTRRFTRIRSENLANPSQFPKEKKNRIVTAWETAGKEIKGAWRRLRAEDRKISLGDISWVLVERGLKRLPPRRDSHQAFFTGLTSERTRPLGLSPFQTLVLAELRTPQSIVEIAVKLGVDPAQVSRARLRILRKAGVWRPERHRSPGR
ncbi:MAG: hypothetical protein J4203_03745 [Candidatus Diapherotrites archaeon]|nr:hypothetical protein [Candidatus Diapherotrites archaeon]